MGPQTQSTPKLALAETAEGGILWVSPEPPPENVTKAVEGKYRLRHMPLTDTVSRHAGGVRVAILYPTGVAPNVRRISAVLDELDRHHMLALVLLDEEHWTLQRLLNRRAHFAVARSDASPPVLAGHLSALVQLQPAMGDLKQELNQVRTFGSDVGRSLTHMDEEMRLAARLQRDFLPKQLPEVGPLRFSIMFRPATWVSGDIYDVTRLDEHHVGFYVADAVGHGMPAALLTMFIKRALPTKRIVGDAYRIVPPDEAMRALNDSICAQNLSNCQFCSAFYCVVNCRTLEMTYSRGGHPEAVLLHADGGTTELATSGGLLGIFPEETFELGKVQLKPNDRLILHSDGVEAVFRGKDSCGRPEMLAEIEKGRHLSAEDMALRLAGVIDCQQGSLHPEDDVTLLTLHVLDD